MKYFSRCCILLCICVQISLGQISSFRFAWLSDTHVGTATGAADLEASVRTINSMADVAFVILSGDISEMGFDHQLELAKTILDSLHKPYYIIPGNHDTKWSPSGCTKFSSLWGKDRFIVNYGGYRFVGMHEGPIMKMGDGHFPPEDLRWLDSTLAALPDKHQPLIFITHYPLDPGIDNWYEVTDRLKHFNTQVVLVGHEHRNRVASFEGIPGIVARSNLSSERSPGGFTIVDVRADSMCVTECNPGKPTQQPWYTLALGPRNFSDTTDRPERPEYGINKTYPDVKQTWTVHAGSTIASTPSVSGNNVIVGNSSGRVTCYSLNDGAIRWEFKTGGTVYSTPDAADGRVVFGSSDRTIYCLDVKSGRKLWSVQAAAPVLAAMAIRDGVVYAGASDGVFRAIDLTTGAIRWQHAGIEGFVEAKPLVFDGKVIFGAWDTYLYALDIRDGSLVWKWTNGNNGILYSPAACWPVGAHGKIFIVAPDRCMTAIDAQTGKTLWRSKRHQVRECIGISEDGERVYARCMTDTVIALSTRSSVPTEVWVSSCGYGYDIDPSMPMEHHGEVVFGTKNGLVYGLDASSGKVRWTHKVGVTIVSTPNIVDDHRVLVSDLDGTVTLIDHSE
ncbi:MAG TPA: PQQ-binding-like beta-propeller repeat protein [Bacteroidota bacterium]|nr:PQQ-binding-like beta-propeller repeat protein [Bacteroidota bacterium]